MIETSDISKALQTLQYHSKDKSKWAKYAGAGLTTLAAFNQAKGIYDRYRNWSDYTVEVRADEPIYTDVLAWVLDAQPPTRRRSTRATVGSWMVASSDDSAPAPEDEYAAVRRRRIVRLVHDGSRESKVSIDGHVVRVTVRAQADVSEHGGGDGSARYSHRYRRVEPSVVFTARDATGHQAIINLLQSITDAYFGEAVERPEISVYRLNQWGDWNRVTAVGRTLESVVLADGLTDRIAADLRTFLDLEEAYINAGLPWHRGYLFYGPPGTGKSSLPKALAHAFGLNVYVVSLPSLKDGESLGSALASVGPRSMLLLEDIDVASAARVRDEEDADGVSMADLLNSLDGMTTPHGLVTVMTTNRLDKLDDALIRPGRADVRELFGLPDRDQLIDLVHAVTGIEVALLEAELPDVPEGVSHADIVGWMKEHLAEPWAAVAAVKDACERQPAF